jgi:hypothetical protein
LRISLPLSLLGLAAALTATIVGAARAAHALRPVDPPPTTRALRAAVDRYRVLAWTYERAARERPAPTSFSYRRSTDHSYLQWTLDAWQRRAYEARGHALARIRRRLHTDLPHAPGLRASLAPRLRYERELTLQLRQIYPGRVTRSFASARAATDRRTFVLWQRRAAAATLSVAVHGAAARVVAPRWLIAAFLCVHRYEGSWTSNTGNGYYGGLQLDRSFMGRYGRDYLARWGTADRWPPWAQLQASVRAYRAGRGFWPWPNTARACGLL